METAPPSAESDTEFYNGMTDDEVIEITINLLADFISDDIKKCYHKI